MENVLKELLEKKTQLCEQRQNNIKKLKELHTSLLTEKNEILDSITRKNVQMPSSKIFIQHAIQKTTEYVEVLENGILVNSKVEQEKSPVLDIQQYLVGKDEYTMKSEKELEEDIEKIKQSIKEKEQQLRDLLSKSKAEHVEMSRLYGEYKSETENLANYCAEIREQKRELERELEMDSEPNFIEELEKTLMMIKLDENKIDD